MMKFGHIDIAWRFYQFCQRSLLSKLKLNMCQGELQVTVHIFRNTYSIFEFIFIYIYYKNEYKIKIKQNDRDLPYHIFVTFINQYQQARPHCLLQHRDFIPINLSRSSSWSRNWQNQRYCKNFFSSYLYVFTNNDNTCMSPVDNNLFIS